MEEPTLPKRERLIRTPPLPNMLHAQMLLPDLAGMFRLGEAMEVPAELVHVAEVAKPAFRASSLIRLQPIQISRCGLRPHPEFAARIENLCSETPFSTMAYIKRGGNTHFDILENGSKKDSQTMRSRQSLIFVSSCTLSLLLASAGSRHVSATWRSPTATGTERISRSSSTLRTKK
jgi:hypothetical protein